jgi:hypothetical protein
MERDARLIMPRRRRRIPWGQPVPERIPEYTWEGDTGDLLGRLEIPTRPKQVPERCLWFVLGAALALGTAAFFTSGDSESAGLHVVTTSEDRIMWVSDERGTVGGCVFEEDRVRCVKTDWMSGPIEFD